MLYTAVDSIKFCPSTLHYTHHLTKLSNNVSFFFFLKISLPEYSQFQSHGKIDSVMLSDIASATFQVFGRLFVACELGQQISNTFSQIDDIFDQFNWYLFPSEVQRILPTAILYVQQPIEVRFFGSFSSDRDQFKRVSITISVLQFYLVIILMRKEKKETRNNAKSHRN